MKSHWHSSLFIICVYVQLKFGFFWFRCQVYICVWISKQHADLSLTCLNLQDLLDAISIHMVMHALILFFFCSAFQQCFGWCFAGSQLIYHLYANVMIPHMISAPICYSRDSTYDLYPHMLMLWFHIWFLSSHMPTVMILFAWLFLLLISPLILSPLYLLSMCTSSWTITFISIVHVYLFYAISFVCLLYVASCAPMCWQYTENSFPRLFSLVTTSIPSYLVNAKG